MSEGILLCTKCKVELPEDDREISWWCWPFCMDCGREMQGEYIRMMEEGEGM
jgi:hypothetical protein